MARLNLTLCVVWTASVVSAATRSGRIGLPPAWVLLTLRNALPIAPNLSDTLATLQGTEHWLHLVGTMVA